LIPAADLRQVSASFSSPPAPIAARSPPASISTSADLRQVSASADLRQLLISASTDLRQLLISASADLRQLLISARSPPVRFLFSGEEALLFLFLVSFSLSFYKRAVNEPARARARLVILSSRA
ncbi:hypothetical protein LINPERHAP1_LOCUS19105, partial [Linum perenne]